MSGEDLAGIWNGLFSEHGMLIYSGDSIYQMMSVEEKNVDWEDCLPS